MSVFVLIWKALAALWQVQPPSAFPLYYCYYFISDIVVKSVSVCVCGTRLLCWCFIPSVVRKCGYLLAPRRLLVCCRPVFQFFHHIAWQFLASCHVIASLFPGQICVFPFPVQVCVCWCWSTGDLILRVTGWFFSLVYYPHLLHSHTLIHTHTRLSLIHISEPTRRA